jgi:hypothetical protein
MKKFLFIYNASADQGSESMDDWMKWFGSIGEHLVDVGNPIQGGTLVKGGSTTELTSFGDLVGGYSLINAEDIAHAVTLAQGCPNAAGIRIFETMPM